MTALLAVTISRGPAGDQGNGFLQGSGSLARRVVEGRHPGVRLGVDIRLPLGAGAAAPPFPAQHAKKRGAEAPRFFAC